MSQNRRFAFMMSCFVFVIALALAADAAAGGAKGLVYQFKAGETYVYAVKIVADRPDAVETYEGHIDIDVKSANADGAVIVPHASLPGKMKSKIAAQPNVGKSFKGKGAPGSGGPVPITLSPGKGSVGGRQVTFDSYGNVVKLTGDIGLSYLLGGVSRLVIEPLSRAGQKRWERSNDVTLREIEDAGPFRGKMPANETRSMAKEAVNWEIVEATDALVRIKKTSDFKTVAGGDAPRLQMIGSGELVFDTKLGLMKSGEYQANFMFSEGNVSAKIPITVSYRLLDATEVATLKKEREERQEKLKEAAKLRAKQAAEGVPMSDEDITKALAEMKQSDVKAMFAAGKLAGATPVEERRAEVVAALTEAVKSSNVQVRKNAVKAFALWGTPKDVPTLVEYLKDSNAFVRTCAREALVGIKDAKGAEAIAQYLPDAAYRPTHAQALKAMGSVAEKAVQPYLKHKDTAVRKEACKILADIGTKQSLAALKVAAADRERTVANEAGAAVQAIQGRK